MSKYYVGMHLKIYDERGQLDHLHTCKYNYFGVRKIE